MSDDLAKEIAKSALRVDWSSTESAARQVAKYAATRIKNLETLRDALQHKVRNLTNLLDDQFGTPCEQIRHQQEVEDFIRKLEMLSLEVTDKEKRIKDLEAQNACLRSEPTFKDEMSEDALIQRTLSSNSSAKAVYIVWNDAIACGRLHSINIKTSVHGITSFEISGNIVKEHTL
jgi:cell shape-determining protein MreC